MGTSQAQRTGKLKDGPSSFVFLICVCVCVCVCVYSVTKTVQLFVSPWTVAYQAPLSFTISHSLLKFMSIELAIQPFHPLPPILLLPTIFPSIRVFSIQSTLCIRWSKYWSFSFSISLPKKYSGLIFFRIDCFDLLAVQRTLKSLPQHHNSRSLLRGFLFFVFLI